MNKIFKVLLITSRSDVGGGPKHVCQLAEDFNKNQNIKLFIAAPYESPYGPIYTELADYFFEMPHRKFGIKYLFQLILFCKEHNIDVVHSHGRGAGVYSRILKLFGFKIVHTYHGIHLEPGLKGKLKLSIDKKLEILTDKLILVSKDELKRANNFGLALSNSIVINNGIHLLSRKSELPLNKKLGTLSRLSYPKGLDILLEYFSKFITQFPNDGYHLEIAGAGEDKEKLESMVEELKLQQHVSFKGEINDIQSFLETINIYISTSRWEGMPLSVLEAMSLQIPCILSEVPGHNSFIEKNIAMPTSSYTSFRDSLIKLMSDRTLQIKIASEAYQYLLSNHSITTQINCTMKVYSSIL